MSFHSKKVREKYSKYLKDNNIQILSDIFERMDLNRRINDSLRILQISENLTPQQLAEKRKIIFRKLARKTAVHLYQKDGSKARVKRIDDKGKHKVLQKLTLQLLSKKTTTDGDSDLDDLTSSSESDSEPAEELQKLSDDDSSEEGQMSGVDERSQTPFSGEDDAIEEVDDEESQISELAELTMKTGMKPLAKRSERFLNVGLSVSKKKKPTNMSVLSQKSMVSRKDTNPSILSDRSPTIKREIEVD
jgi:hypothetical protein